MGMAAAQSPKAPSTCTQPPCSRTTSIAERRSSQAPVLTFPACRQTRVGPGGPDDRTLRRSWTSMAPFGSAATGSTTRLPKPSSRSDRSMVACRSAPATTRTARRAEQAVLARHPIRPRPARDGARRPGPTVLAACAPVTKPTLAPAGSPSNSLSQPPATSSAIAADGDVAALNATWSQPAAMMSAAVAEGSAPPMTKPKNRGPAVATNPGSAAAISSFSTSAAGVPFACSGPPKAVRKESRLTVGATRRSLSPVRKPAADRAASANSSR